MRLEPPEYCFKIKGVTVGSAKIKMNYYLSINPGGIKDEISGEKTRDPAFGLPAVWITDDQRERAENLGYTVVDPPSIIATHLTEIIKRHAAEILGRQEVQAILDALKADFPAVTDEVIKSLNIGIIQKVLQGLLLEQVSIRNMVTILETMADYASVTKDIGFLVEKVRQSLSRQISLHYADETKTLHVLTINPGLEQKIINSRVETAMGVRSALEPQIQRRWLTSLMNAVKHVQEKGFIPIILSSEAARPLVKSSTARELPQLVALSILELDTDIAVESLGEISIEE
jgi:flagellar biosynthesis protein FlhA